jgi:putative transposase
MWPEAGCAWRLLPHEFPAWQTVYGYFRRWTVKGLWQRIHDTLRAWVRQKAGRHKHPTAGSIDTEVSPKFSMAPSRHHT